MSPPTTTGRRGAGAAELEAARAHDRASRVDEAMRSYAEALTLADGEGDIATLAEAARRLAVLHQQRGDTAEAVRFCTLSHESARRAGLGPLAAQALNTMGIIRMMGGEPAEARAAFEAALAGGHATVELRARVEQNLGVLVNIHGDHEEALRHYRRSLAAFQELGDARGCAIALHNVGMVHADRGEERAAEENFRESLGIARREGDRSLQGICLVNLAEVEVTRQHFEDAREYAEQALDLFTQLDAIRGRADAYRVIGIVYRETGRPALAESRLTHAIGLAVASGATLIEAEASRDLALLHQASGRNVDALRSLGRAHRLFRRLDAQKDAVHVGGRKAELEGTYLRVVREWGESIESNDSRTFGHCERVARNAVAVCRELGLAPEAEQTILLGAYLHDLGMVRVPHEILRATTPLSRGDWVLLERHPAWGIELLAGVEFPWDLKPIVRWHHERRDGTGYPDGLCGDAIPLGAQVVGLLDTYDEHLAGRFGRPALSPGEAMAAILATRHYWSESVVEAFVRACQSTSARPPS